MVNWSFLFFFPSLCTYSVLWTLEAPMRGPIYWLQSNDYAIGITSSLWDVTFWWRCLWWFPSFSTLIIGFGSPLRLAYDRCLWCQWSHNCAIWACVHRLWSNIFLLILGLLSLSVIIASGAKLWTVGSEHMPYSQRLHCRTLSCPQPLLALLFLWLLSTIMCTAVLGTQVEYMQD